MNTFWKPVYWVGYLPNNCATLQRNVTAWGMHFVRHLLVHLFQAFLACEVFLSRKRQRERERERERERGRTPRHETADSDRSWAAAEVYTAEWSARELINSTPNCQLYRTGCLLTATLLAVETVCRMCHWNTGKTYSHYSVQLLARNDASRCFVIYRRFICWFSYARGFSTVGGVYRSQLIFNIRAISHSVTRLYFIKALRLSSFAFWVN